MKDRVTIAPILLFMTLTATAGWPVARAAAETVHPICPLVLHQVRGDLDESEIGVDLASSDLDAAESIFSLVDELWHSDAVERITYLAAKHDRDLAAVELERWRLLVERNRAELEQYVSYCASPNPDRMDEQTRKRIEEAQNRYARTDCHMFKKDLEAATIDRAYREEVLASVRELRESGSATQQEVVLAQRDVERARKRVAHNEERVKECSGREDRPDRRE